MILGTYKITYSNGVSQKKALIPHIEYEKAKVLKDGIKNLEKEVGEYFTDQSPLHDAIETSILKHFGGESPVKFEKL